MKDKRPKWSLLLLLLLLGGAAYFLMDLPMPFLDDGDDTPASTAETSVPAGDGGFTFPNLREGMTDCRNGVAVTGALSCEFGTAVSLGLHSVGGAAAAEGDTLTVPAVHDPVREIDVDVVCTIGKPTVCALGADDSVYVNR